MGVRGWVRVVVGGRIGVGRVDGLSTDDQGGRGGYGLDEIRGGQKPVVPSMQRMWTRTSPVSNSSTKDSGRASSAARAVLSWPWMNWVWLREDLGEDREDAEDMEELSVWQREAQRSSAARRAWREGSV